MNEWKVGQEIIVKAQPFNHVDDREITLRYLGEGVLQDVTNGNKVMFNTMLFPYIYENMNLPLGLVHNRLVRESYKVVRVI
jgi:hypothetical protein